MGCKKQMAMFFNFLGGVHIGNGKSSNPWASMKVPGAAQDMDNINGFKTGY